MSGYLNSQTGCLEKSVEMSVQSAYLHYLNSFPDYPRCCLNSLSRCFKEFIWLSGHYLNFQTVCLISKFAIFLRELCAFSLDNPAGCYAIWVTVYTVCGLSSQAITMFRKLVCYRLDYLSTCLRCQTSFLDRPPGYLGKLTECRGPRFLTQISNIFLRVRGQYSENYPLFQTFYLSAKNFGTKPWPNNKNQRFEYFENKEKIFSHIFDIFTHACAQLNFPQPDYTRDCYYFYLRKTTRGGGGGKRPINCNNYCGRMIYTILRLDYTFVGLKVIFEPAKCVAIRPKSGNAAR